MILADTNWKYRDSVLLSRRTLLAGAGVSLLSAGCSSVSDCSVGSQLEQAQCRQQNIRSTAVRNVTAGVLVGAALGAGFGIAAGLDPATMAIAGALIGGGAAAAERYFAYKLEQARYDQALALQQVVSDIAQDQKYALAAYKDIQIARNEIDAAFTKMEGSIAEATRKAEEAKNLVTEVRRNRETFQKAHQIYDTVIQTTPLESNSTARDLNNGLFSEAERIEAQEKAVLRDLYGEYS